MPAKKATFLAAIASVLVSMMPCSAHGDETVSVASPAKPYALTGHADLVSAYYLRGITSTYGNSYPGLGNAGADAPESSRPVLQWGADWAHESGWYAGYWGSQINYSYKRLGESYDDRTIVSGFQDTKSIENDFYGGYTAKAGDFTYTLGLSGYAYVNGKHANGLETKLGIGYKEFGLNAQTLLNDTVWGNQSDTYWSLTYATALPRDMNFSTSLGWYTYREEGKFLGTRDTLNGTNCAAGSAFAINGCFAGDLPIGNGFRHIIFGLSQPIGKSGLGWSLQGIIGGVNRFGVQQANKGVGSIKYAF